MQSNTNFTYPFVKSTSFLKLKNGNMKRNKISLQRHLLRIKELYIQYIR